MRDIGNNLSSTLLVVAVLSLTGCDRGGDSNESAVEETAESEESRGRSGPVSPPRTDAGAVMEAGADADIRPLLRILDGERGHPSDLREHYPDLRKRRLGEWAAKLSNEERVNPVEPAKRDPEGRRERLTQKLSPEAAQQIEAWMKAQDQPQQTPRRRMRILLDAVELGQGPGSVDMYEARRAVMREYGPLRSCYSKQLDSPETKGWVKAVVSIELRGSQKASKVGAEIRGEGQVADPEELARCLRSVFLQTELPNPEGGFTTLRVKLLYAPVDE